MVYENIPTILNSVVMMFYNSGQLGVGEYSLARMWDIFRTDGNVSSVTTILSQIALVVSIALVLFIFYVLAQKRALKAGAPALVVAPTVSSETEVHAGALRGRWGEITKLLDSPREADWKVAVLESDKLMDDALARSGFSGDTFGDRLSNIQPGTLLSLDGIWWAHKIRNRLAHETDYFLRYTEARQAVGYFEAALAELQLI